MVVNGSWLILGGGGFVIMVGCGWWRGSNFVGGLWVVVVVVAVGIEFIYLFILFV